MIRQATRQLRHHIFMPPEMMARLRAAKAKTGMPVAEFIRRAIEAALDAAGVK
jgi:predicted DNA-binding protein